MKEYTIKYMNMKALNSSSRVIIEAKNKSEATRIFFRNLPDKNSYRIVSTKES